MPLFKSALPSERIAGSIRSGLRYVRYSPTLQSSLLRAFTFTFFVSAVWSLLAVVAKRDLQQGALGYGILNGSLGLGAVIAATTAATVRQQVWSEPDYCASRRVYNGADAAGAGPGAVSPSVIIAVLVVCGLCVDEHDVDAEYFGAAGGAGVGAGAGAGDVPDDVSGRDGAGIDLWGFVAEHTSTPVALATAAVRLIGDAAVCATLSNSAGSAAGPYAIPVETSCAAACV